MVKNKLEWTLNGNSKRTMQFRIANNTEKEIEKYKVSERERKHLTIVLLNVEYSTPCSLFSCDSVSCDTVHPKYIRCTLQMHNLVICM